MRRAAAVISVLLAAGGALAGCASAATTAHSSAEHFTLQIKLDATKVVVGTQISGTAIVRNETEKSIPSPTCPQGWVDVGLVGHGATFTPISDLLCTSRKVFKPHSTMRFPITVETTYDGCGFSGVPRCPHGGIPLLPLGRYTLDVVNTGLPASIDVLGTQKVTLVNATSGRSDGPIGGSILIQAYGCETVAYPQPPIAVLLDQGGRVIARRNNLGLTQELIVGVRPGTYVVRSSVRPVHLVHVTNGVQSVATVIPRCN